MDTAELGKWLNIFFSVSGFPQTCLRGRKVGETPQLAMANILSLTVYFFTSLLIRFLSDLNFSYSYGSLCLYLIIFVTYL